MSAETVISQSPSPSETEGNLEATSVAHLLAEGWRDRRTGQLTLIGKNAECRIEMTNGAPTGLESTKAEDHFALSLENSKTIGVADRLKAEKFAQEHACSQARAILSLGLLDATSLYQKLREATSLDLGALLEWKQGEFLWEAPCPDAKPGKPFDVLKLIQTELPRRWPVERLFEDLLPHSERVCEVVPNFRRIVIKLSQSSAMAKRMIQGIDGSTSIGRMLGAAAGDASAAATLWVLVHAGLVRTCAAHVDSENMNIEFEVLVDDVIKTSASSNDTTSLEASSVGTKSTHQTDGNSRAESIRTEVALLLSQMDDVGHYEMLGVPNDAGAADIKKAYFKAAKKFHPDALGQLDLHDIADDAAMVFARIAEAFETLSNTDKRSAYDRGDVEATQIDTARLAQAETAYRKGEILLRMGNFAGAIDYLESAADLWPEEPAYQAALGWALFKQPKSDPERAIEHLAMAHDQSPDEAVTLFRMGLILKGMGEHERSKECIAKARRLDPDVKD